MQDNIPQFFFSRVSCQAPAMFQEVNREAFDQRRNLNGGREIAQVMRTKTIPKSGLRLSRTDSDTLSVGGLTRGSLVVNELRNSHTQVCSTAFGVIGT